VIGEFELINRLRAKAGLRGDRVLRGAGDDAAVVRTDGVVVVSVDAFVEGVHFRLATTSLEDLGHKCVAAGLSDLAAMGASAGEVYLVLGLPENIGDREVMELMHGAEALASRFGVTICGGDLTASNELFVAVTAIGHAPDESHLIGRGGARPGDVLGVTGRLGGAGAGLMLLERKEHGIPIEIGEALIDRQRRPVPRLEAGAALARAGVSAMIDLSDGLASDCARLSEESGVMLEVQLAEIPVEDGVDEVAALLGTTGAEFAAGAGEDYELLLTVAPEQASTVDQAAEAAGVQVSWVGKALEGSGVRLLDRSGSHRPLQGWDHFARRSSGRPHPGQA
jgi:thiamine-monophosphate kinase